MNDFVGQAGAWLGAGGSVALATVVRTWGSAPRQAGSKMLISDAGEMSGSVSGGCVEAAVVEQALAALKEGRARRLHFGVADETAWEVGLTCGGEIDIFVEPVPTETAPNHLLLDALRSVEGGAAPFVRAVVVGGAAGALGAVAHIDPEGGVRGSLPFEVGDLAAVDARGVILRGVAETRSYRSTDGEVEVLLDPWLPPPTLTIVGGVHIAMVLARLAHAIGYRVAIVDPRGAFATEERFPEADIIDRSWPDEGLRRIGLTSATAVAVLSHDPKLDDPALLAALTSPAFYVGALGSVRTNVRRRDRLQAAGVSDEPLSRLRSPIGLDLGRHDPAGIALGILAEIVAARAAQKGGTSSLLSTDL